MKKILIIEDEVAYAKLLHSKLSANYSVLHALDGKQGLAMALKEKPNLILLDIRMPVMDGMTALSKLRQDLHGKNTNVILLSNLEVNDEVMIQIVKDPLTYYFIKSDITLNEVLDKIRSTLEELA